MKRTIGAILYDGQLGTVTRELPELADNQVLVEVHTSLISPGSEMKAAARQRKNPRPTDSEPTEFGYSNAGIVLKTKGDCRGLKPGMRVACLRQIAGRSVLPDLQPSVYGS